MKKKQQKDEKKGREGGDIKKKKKRKRPRFPQGSGADPFGCGPRGCAGGAQGPSPPALSPPSPRRAHFIKVIISLDFLGFLITLLVCSP